MHYFHNTTPLSPIFFRQFGLSIKKEGAIGQFGTGLKYAIASILRGGGHIRLHTAGTSHRFSTRTEWIGKHRVEIVTMDGEDLPFNLALGKNWKPWMAFRELWCNALDEGGGYTTDKPNDTTVIEVDWSAFDIIDLRKYFLLGNESFTPLFDGEELQVIRERPGCAYYKGVFVGKRETSSFGVILKGERWMNYLTEDRVLASTYWITSTIADEVNRLPVDELLNVWRAFDPLGDVRDLRPPPDAAMEKFAALYEIGILASNEAKMAIDQWERRQPPIVRDPTDHETRYIERAKRVLENAGITIRQPIRIKEHSHSRTMAQTDGTTIYLNAKSFDGGLRDILKCFLEEIAHIEYSTEDETYGHQHALLDLWIRAYTKLSGEVL